MNRIYYRDLQCYQIASEKTKQSGLFFPDRYFDLSKLPEGKIMQEMEKFIRYRGTMLVPSSIRKEATAYNKLCSFLRSECPNLHSFLDISPAAMEKKAKVWLLKNGRPVTRQRKKSETGKIIVVNTELVLYIRKIYAFLIPEKQEFCYESDRWYLEGLPVRYRKNPVLATKSLSFEKILQSGIKKEVKQVIYIHLAQKALGTVCAEITELNRFSAYLGRKHPEIRSLNEIDRKMLEEYLVYINTEAEGKKSYSRELFHLRGVIVTAGKILENEELENLFFMDDIGKMPEKLYRVYSDDEIKRLNAAIVERDGQIARALFIHQLLGTRISETLTLTQDSIYTGEGGGLMIKIKQIKTGKEYRKAINEDIKKLFDKACSYTNEKFGCRKYVFVNEKNPDEPMRYSRIQYQIMAMVQQKDLRDDTGKLFGVGTHIWRHCYGKKLTELHIDDVTIAKLMGHANTSSLKYYRKVGNQMLADETREMRNSMDELIREIFMDNHEKQ